MKKNLDISDEVVEAISILAITKNIKTVNK